MENLGSKRTEIKEKPKTFSEVCDKATDKLEELRNSVAFGEVRGGSNEEFLEKYDNEDYKHQIQGPIAKLIKALEESKQFDNNSKISETFEVEKAILNAMRLINEKEQENKGIIKDDIRNILERAA